jgi:hypothetical protein
MIGEFPAIKIIAMSGNIAAEVRLFVAERLGTAAVLESRSHSTSCWTLWIRL